MSNINHRKKPHECTDISEVRAEIDSIDKDIIRLLAERFGYVREVVKYKERTDSGIEAPDRRASVITSRREWASAVGIDPSVVEQIYNTLIDYFIAEEKQIASLGSDV